MKNFLIASALASVALGSSAPAPNQALEIVARHREIAKSLNGTVVKDPSQRTAGSSGSVVYSFHSDADTCKSEASSGAGYVFGGCVTSSGDSGIYYTDCSDNGSEVMLTMHSCESGDCSSDCIEVIFPMDKCDGGTKMTCSNKADSYTEFDEFTFHYE